MKYEIIFSFRTDGIHHVFRYEVTADTPIDALINARSEYGKPPLKDKPPFNNVVEVNIERVSHLTI